MINFQKISTKLSNFGIVPVIRLSNQNQAIPLIQTLIQGGLPVAEITLRTPCAVSCIETINTEYPDFFIGAGTVLTVSQAEDAVLAGAKFIVCPGLVIDVVNWCLAKDIPVYPGVCTPTEICTALALGLHELKFFPATDFGGLKTIKSLLSVFNDISMMPTGGITIDNCGEYLQTPGILCCGGTFVAPLALIEAGKYDDILRIVQRTVASVAAIKKTTYHQ
jgi:2-dehydro-3-deoxyphosphogluconate aldolase/(4S)-4-hydroxy-2-oxoglutarate aldolase